MLPTSGSRIPSPRFCFLFLLLSYGLIACEESPAEITEPATEAKANNIVLIFNEAPDHRIYRESEDGPWIKSRYLDVRYYDDQGLLQQIAPTYGAAADTVSLLCERNSLQLIHTYRGIDEFNYQFQRGDTVQFTYPQQVPYAEVVNRAVPPKKLNYDYYWRQHLKTEFPALVGFEFPLVFIEVDFARPGPPPDPGKLRAEAAGKAIRELKREVQWSDSLLRAGVIDENTRRLLSRRQQYTDLLLSANDKAEPLQAIIEEAEDTLIYDPAYRKLLNRYVLIRYMQQVPVLDQKNARFPDFRQVYEQVAAADLFDKRTKGLLLYDLLHLIIQHFSMADRAAYLEKFEAAGFDQALSRSLKTTYRLDGDLSDDLVLQNIDSVTTAFKSVLQEHQGKVIYVDFWASWCAPCRKVMPDSHALQEAYKDREIAFVYLSLDEDAAKWKQAARAEQLTDPDRSFILVNRYTSTQIEQLAVNTIPRYLLYDREGRLVHANAPGPATTEIRSLLDQYLAQ